MKLFAHCKKYIKIVNDTNRRVKNDTTITADTKKRCKIPFELMSYINVTLMTYCTLIVAYLVTLNHTVHLNYLNCWFTLAIIGNIVFNAPTLFWRRADEDDEVIYEMKLLFSLYLGNLLLYNMTANNDTPVLDECYIFANNIVYVFVLMITFVEFTILLGCVVGIYTDYRYTKSCFLLTAFICSMIIVATVNLERLKSEALVNITFMLVHLFMSHVIVAIVWSLYNNQKRLFHIIINNNNNHIMYQKTDSVNKNDNYDPPPSFSSVVEMKNMSKV
jgi:hypothetical protein